MAEIPANLNPCNPQSLPPINQPVTPLCHFHMCLCGSHYFNIYTPCSYSYSFHFILPVHYHFCTCMRDGPHGLSILIKSLRSLLSDRLGAHAYKRENGVTNEAIVIEWAAAAAW